MSKRDELLKALKKLKELNLSELKFLEKENLDLKDMEHFRDKKIKFKNLIDSLLKTIELNDKTEVAEHEVVSTGSAVIDEASGIGGIATGRCYMIYG